MASAFVHNGFKSKPQSLETAQQKPPVALVAAIRKTTRKTRGWTGAAMSHALLYC
jgi:hypothetical protein